AARSRAFEPGTDQNREAGGYRQPEGLPQRGGQILVTVAGPERRQESELDLLREDSRCDRKADILAGRGPASGHLLRVEEGRRDGEEARRVRRTHGGARLHRASGSPARRMVHACEAGRLRRMERMEKCPFTLLTGA